MKMAMSNEAKTGLMVVVCVAVLAGLLIRVGNFTFFQHGYTVKTRFHFTEGIKKSSPVRLSGVEVGDIKSIQLLYGDETLAEVVMWLRDGVKLHMDSQASVATLGLMGEKYIEIRPGTAASPLAKEGDMISGKDPVRMEDLIEIGTKVAGDVSQTMKDISKLATDLDGAVQGNRSKLDNIFENLDETSENFREFSQDIKYHPWKVLAHGKEKSKEEIEKDREARRASKNKAKAAA